MKLRDLFLRLHAMVAPHRVERELDEELAFHIERDTQKHIAAGLSPIDARKRAISRFGSVSLAADQCRDERGTGLIDDLARDIRYAFRTFRRAPLAALTIVSTIAIGLGLVAAVFTFYSMFFFRVDAVRNPDELFAVVRPTSPGADSRAPLTRADYEALRRESGVFVDVAAVSSLETRIDGRAASPMLVTGNFFQLLGVHAALGRTLMPGDDEPSAGRPIVFSHRAWMKLFAGDPTILGRGVRINGVPCVAVGVMPESFRGLNIAPPDFWAPLTLAGEFRPTEAGGEADRPVTAVGRLKSGVSREQATAGLEVWARTHPKTVGGRPVSITLEPRQGTLSDWLEVLAFFSPIFFAFGLILMIGCANVANLLLARAVARQREIGIRLSLGASRRRIIRQLLTESLILALTSAACGFAVSRVCLEGASYAVTATMPGEIAEQVNFGVPAADWRVVVFLMVSAVVATISFGLVPALQASRVELVRAARGEVTRDARPGRARDLLIGVQVGTSALLLICAAIFLRSAFAAAQASPGLRTRDTIRVPIANEPRREAIVREVMAHASVVAVAASSAPALAEASVSGEASADTRLADSAEGRRSVAVNYQLVSPGYFQLLEVDLIRGRGFTEAEGTPKPASRWLLKAPRGSSGRTVTPSGRSSAYSPAPSPSSALHAMCVAD